MNPSALALTLAGIAVIPVPVSASTAKSAASHTEDWCADSVDFAMRTAQRRADGSSKQALAAEIHTHYIVFKQQYPELVERDMQRLVDSVYQHRFNRFKAAVAANHACGTLTTASDQSDSERATGAGE